MSNTPVVVCNTHVCVSNTRVCVSNTRVCVCPTLVCVTLEGLGKAASALMEEGDMAVRAGATKLRDLASSAQH